MIITGLIGLLFYLAGRKQFIRQSFPKRISDKEWSFSPEKYTHAKTMEAG
jgi:hypothetical protein